MIADIVGFYLLKTRYLCSTGYVYVKRGKEWFIGDISMYINKKRVIDS